MKDYLPIGSIVLLKNGSKRIMVYGRKQTSVRTQQEFDYIACLYPEGNIGERFMYLFNNEDISEVVFRGFSDAEDEAVVKQLNEVQN